MGSPEARPCADNDDSVSCRDCYNECEEASGVSVVADDTVYEYSRRLRKKAMDAGRGAGRKTTTPKNLGTNQRNNFAAGIRGR